jgi:hypothetical protein
MRRDALFAKASTAIARGMREAPAMSPTRPRRSGLSPAQAPPLMKLATARCQISSAPAAATTNSATVLANSAPWLTSRPRRREIRAASEPSRTPNSPIGSIVMLATQKADSVCW